MSKELCLRAVFIDDTMIRKGVLFLCIFGSPYAFGKLESLECNLKYCCLEI